MKKLTKWLALGMALALTFGMTVSAEEGDAPSPDATALLATHGNNGVSVTAITDEDVYESVWYDAEVKAHGTLAMAEQMTNANGSNYVIDPRNVEIEIKEIFHLTSAMINGGITVDPGVLKTKNMYFYQLTQWNKTWGVAVYRLRDNKMTQLTPILEDGYIGKKLMGFTTGLAHDEGSDYALVVWHLNYMSNPLQFSGTHIGIKNGSFEVPYTDHAARAQQFLMPKSNTNVIGQDLGNKMAAEKCGSLYRYDSLVGTTKLNLAGGSSYVVFELPKLDDGVQNYMMVLYPYHTADGKMTNDYPDLTIEKPYTVVLTNDNINLGMYSATINQGTWLATLIKVVEDPSLVPADPTAGVAATATAPSTDAGVQAAGVVSPKTGEMLPVAVILAVICLAGAAVCAKKARNNA